MPMITGEYCKHCVEAQAMAGIQISGNLYIVANLLVHHHQFYWQIFLLIWCFVLFHIGKSQVKRSIARRELYSVPQNVNSKSTGILQAILQQDRNVTRKLGSQTRGLQLYATPLNALNLKPCVIIYDGVCHLCNAGKIIHDLFAELFNDYIEFVCTIS